MTPRMLVTSHTQQMIQQLEQWLDQDALDKMDAERDQPDAEWYAEQDADWKVDHERR